MSGVAMVSAQWRLRDNVCGDANQLLAGSAMTRPVEIVDDRAVAPNEPGIGVNFDWDRLAAFEQRN